MPETRTFWRHCLHEVEKAGALDILLRDPFQRLFDGDCKHMCEARSSTRVAVRAPHPQRVHLIAQMTSCTHCICGSVIRAAAFLQREPGGSLYEE
eukprot:3031824-Pleurochrysis_carterae.AAC.2